MRLVRYLAIPVGVCSGGFLPMRDVPQAFRPTNWSKDYGLCGAMRKNCPRSGSFESNEFHGKHIASDNHSENVAALNVAERSTAGTVDRRTALILSGFAASGASKAEAVDFGNESDAITTTTSIAKNLLESSSIYKVRTSPTTQKRRGPSVTKVSNEDLLLALRSKRALFLGEHHPEGRDHRLQAALIRSLYESFLATNNPSTAMDGDVSASATLVVGLEAVQRRFQPVLDKYCSGSIDEAELRTKTEWDSRWYWSFEAYAPIFRTCRELGIGLLALDISTEDRIRVESGGLEALDPTTLREYLPDRRGFDAFGSTKAYEAFVSYTLKPPYELQQRTPLGKRSANTTMPFSNFVARQMLRDGSMASAALEWLATNPKGILVGCIGINHATFGCGVPGRLEQMLSSQHARDTESKREENGLVASILINPEPLNTGTELKICKTEGKQPVVEDDDDDDDVARRIFVPNTRNQICIENSIELQNYALQLGYAPQSIDPKGRRTAINEASSAMQDRNRDAVLGLSDYLVFSPKQTMTTNL